ncbi:MAG: NAD(+) diphosphatase [Colwellia sp.]|nr:NAD(+) diphosphatase [Colwellia sp.]
MSLTYSNMPLDRCTNQRKNKRWLVAEFNHHNTLFCIIKDGMSFFDKNDELLPVYLSKEQLNSVGIDSCIYLGKGAGQSIFAVDYHKLHFSAQDHLDECGQWLPLRQITAALKSRDAAIFALAKALVHWHNSHQYCGHCGNINKPIEAGHARKCTQCRNLTFPRTDPAVIMLVERMFDDGIARCLLGRQASWPEGVFSTLAGFVDPGESLEEAVIREVLEETAIEVEKPHYISSQPWPFPSSIMLGFTAQATSETIDTRQDDLQVAQWFTREQLANFLTNTSGINTEVQKKKQMDNKSKPVETATEQQYKMSSRDSISSYLITAWLNKEIGKY